MFCQVGINTALPTTILDINGNLRIRDVKLGSDVYLLTIDENGYVSKIKLSDIVKESCPKLVQNSSNPWSITFESESGKDFGAEIILNSLKFTRSGSWKQGDIFYFSYTNNSGKPLTGNYTIGSCSYP